MARFGNGRDVTPNFMLDGVERHMLLTNGRKICVGLQKDAFEMLAETDNDVTFFLNVRFLNLEMGIFWFSVLHNRFQKD